MHKRMDAAIAREGFWMLEQLDPEIQRRSQKLTEDAETAGLGRGNAPALSENGKVPGGRPAAVARRPQSRRRNRPPRNFTTVLDQA